MEIKRIAIVVDGPNLYHATRQLGIRINFQNLLYKFSGENVAFPILKIFYDQIQWINGENSFLDSMRNLGFEIVPVPLKEYGKNGNDNGKRFKSRTDQMITVHLMEHLLKDEFDTLVFFSGDSDYQFLLQKIRNARKEIIIFGSKAMMAADLQSVGKIFLFENFRPDSDLIFRAAG
jgi:uncharacterized LabA/DUF88 family protein